MPTITMGSRFGRRKRGTAWRFDAPHGGRTLATGVLAAVAVIVATATPAAAAPSAPAPGTTTDQSSQISLLISLLDAPA